MSEYRSVRANLDTLQFLTDSELYTKGGHKLGSNKNHMTCRRMTRHAPARRAVYAAIAQIRQESNDE